MLFESKTITLKNGRTALLRAPHPEDAAEMAEYMKRTAGETHFLMRTPEECTVTAEQEAIYLQNIIDSPDNLMIVCEIDGRIAGNCQITFRNRVKSRHRASVAIALLKEFWGLGIGTAMFEEMIAAAYGRGGIMQLELEFIEGNDRARALYEKMGFRIVAELPNDTRLPDSTLLSLFFMVKTL